MRTKRSTKELLLEYLKETEPDVRELGECSIYYYCASPMVACTYTVQVQIADSGDLVFVNVNIIEYMTWIYNHKEKVCKN